MTDDAPTVRAVLEARRDALRRQVGGLAAPPERGATQGFGKRIGDGTVEAISRLTDIGVGGTLEISLARVERALEKLADGTYGRCDACDQPIADARLAARPESVMCVGCAALERHPPPPRR
jgi:DnaK suppressor protein